MDRIFLLLSWLTCSSAFSQTWYLDKGEGDIEHLRTAFTALQLMEGNKPAELRKFLSPASGITSDSLVAWSEQVSVVHPPHDNTKGSAPCFCNYAGNGLWYERTYYLGNSEAPRYVLQVHFDLEEVSGTICIQHIDLRTGNEIMNLDSEFKFLRDRKEEEPPPPPPPFGLPPP
jgi:hypothetical protein